eukprot:TRINITY_DN93890_c0_g1_i1.p1 TRINITY_DN93890_c0_g1~~TRINITY_DN93890_c0_g1_i1.p1  ORF type:complete len:276 (+),score=78.68 TRINITY_DN93890_c0_g1_i1:72-899(+)
MKGGRGAHGKRSAVPYNTYVARERQKKYYEKKKTFSRFGRLQRFEERREQEDEAKTKSKTKRNVLLDRIVDEGEDELDAEYQRRLDLSFGGSESTLPAKALRPKKKKGKQGKAVAEVVEDPDRQTNSLGAFKEEVRSRKKKRDASSGTQEASSKIKQQSDEAVIEKESKKISSKGSGKGSGKAKGKHQQGVPNRFQKDLRQYQEAQAAKAAEENRREDEQRMRNRKRKEHGKERAMMGQLLAKRNARGQPSMQNMLEGLAAKLGSGVSSQKRFRK